jgi:peptidoglycan/xylan/chitin deacetylase (PgdA/CDA1 family)
MKEVLQGFVRGFHTLLLNRGLPDRMGLYFHNIESSQRDTFSDVILRLKDLGYRFVDVEAYTRSGTKGPARIPAGNIVESSGKQASVSFDDNYVEWHESLELLERLGVRATFYVNTAPLRDSATETEIQEYYEQRLRYKGKPTRPLNMDEVRAIRDAGHTIGVHTHNHYVLSELPIETAKEEIYICRDRLEQGLGQRLRHFSYPFGMRRHFSPALKAYCLESGFETIAQATPGMLHERFDGVTIQRTDWRLGDTFESNEVRFSIDGRLFERLTGRSAVA